MAVNNESVSKVLDVLTRSVQEDLNSEYMQGYIAATIVARCDNVRADSTQLVAGIQTIVGTLIQRNMASINEKLQTTINVSSAAPRTTEAPPSTKVSTDASALLVATTAEELPKKRLSMFSPEEVEQSCVYSSEAEEDDDNDNDKGDLALKDWTADNVRCFVTMLKLHQTTAGNDGYGADEVRRLKFCDETNGCRVYVVGRLQYPSNKKACLYRTVVALIEKRRLMSGGQAEHVNAVHIARTDFSTDKKNGSKSPYFDVTKMLPLKDGPLGEGVVDITVDVYNFADARSRADFCAMMRGALMELKNATMDADVARRERIEAETLPYSSLRSERAAETTAATKKKTGQFAGRRTSFSDFDD